ncbi:uncharacterized protein LOC124815034 [Hydra vulgaris]|uniref:uncharacterized protein LOC124815034 n=1 Tax=Hydra vulgaris TaxID=6087 RepID=UPI001F5F1EF4|nr:uncharacterized protein LOC124815034 [Hydra vulgaris]
MKRRFYSGAIQIEQAIQTQSVSDNGNIENIVVPIAEDPILEQQPAGNLNIVNQERVETEISLQENAGENKIGDMETEITDPIHQGNLSARWGISRGWRRLKDHIPSHESSIYHKANYVVWKPASRAALCETSVDNLLLSELKTETEIWKKLFQRILDAIIFLSERGLALFGSNQRIAEHVKHVQESQQYKQRIQAHYLSMRIQNEFIDICSSHVQTAILHEIVKAKYFSIIVDATPDCSYKEQTTLRNRCSNNRNIENFEAGFRRIGQAYDNSANMAGKYNGGQAVLIQQNLNCMFSSCGNHSLNLVGVDCAESCKEAVTYFGTIQQTHNLLSSSLQRWEILKQHLPVSLHGMSKTRWSARIDGVKPVTQYLNPVRSALNELGVLHLTAQAKIELDAI